MKYNPNIHHRRSIRLKGYDYSQAGLCFITICTKDREYLFGEIINDDMVLNDAGKNANYCWFQIPNHFPNTILHEYITMPNHIHGIIEITKPVGANNHLPQNNETSKIVDSQFYRANDYSHLPQSPSKTIGSIVRGYKIGKRIKFNEQLNLRI